jgi:hypothetical protein
VSNFLEFLFFSEKNIYLIFTPKCPFIYPKSDVKVSYQSLIKVPDSMIPVLT